jgi:adenylate cyclase
VEARVLSVGLADLTGYAALLERLPAPDAVGVLQECLEAAGECVVARGGVIRKYLGDALLFTFEEPGAAVAAARALAALPARAVAGLSLRWRVAVATGEVVLARIGHPSLALEDVLGVPVNRAARLLRAAAAAPDGVLLCPETRRRAAAQAPSSSSANSSRSAP